MPGTLGGAFCTPSSAYGASAAATHELWQLAPPFAATPAVPLVPPVADPFTGAASVPICVPVTEPDCDDWSKAGKGNRRSRATGGGSGDASPGHAALPFFRGDDANSTTGGKVTEHHGGLPFYRGEDGNSSSSGTQARRLAGVARVML